MGAYTFLLQLFPTTPTTILIPNVPMDFLRKNQHKKGTKKALPNCNIVCLTGEELKADVSGYLQVLYDADPAAVGGTLPGEDFYWAAQ